MSTGTAGTDCPHATAAGRDGRGWLVGGTDTRWDMRTPVKGHKDPSDLVGCRDLEDLKPKYWGPPAPLGEPDTPTQLLPVAAPYADTPAPKISPGRTGWGHPPAPLGVEGPCGPAGLGDGCWAGEGGAEPGGGG